MLSLIVELNGIVLPQRDIRLILVCMLGSRLLIRIKDAFSEGWWNMRLH